MNAWTGFFQASASASATLAGLLVVAISINLSRILDFPQLPDRAAAALVPAAGVLVVSLLALAPGQPVRMFGAEVFAAGARGIIATLLVGIMNAWVLLIEILR